MRIPREDVNLYFRLMNALQAFVRECMGLPGGDESGEEADGPALGEKLAVREALFENSRLIDDFVRENPAELPGEELAIVFGWKNFVLGDFYIERLTREGAIFVGGERVYTVRALNDDFTTIFHPSQLPFLTRAVLLPFKESIIYDGILQGYDMAQGSDLRRNLEEVYGAAKLNGRIVEKLPTGQLPYAALLAPQSQSPHAETLESLSQTVSGMLADPGHDGAMKSALRLLTFAIRLAGLIARKPAGTAEAMALVNDASNALAGIKRALTSR